MNNLKQLNHGEKFSHATVGKLSCINGKIFLKDQLQQTSCEISFGTLEPRLAVPFFHSHKANEENYIILSGEGTFQVDDEVFPISEGSVVRVATGCDRNIKNTSSATNLSYICIQAKEDSLDAYTQSDAIITDRPSLL